MIGLRVYLPPARKGIFLVGYLLLAFGVVYIRRGLTAGIAGLAIACVIEATMAYLHVRAGIRLGIPAERLWEYRFREDVDTNVGSKKALEIATSALAAVSASQPWPNEAGTRVRVSVRRGLAMPSSVEIEITSLGDDRTCLTVSSSTYGALLFDYGANWRIGKLSVQSTSFPRPRARRSTALAARPGGRVSVGGGKVRCPNLVIIRAGRKVAVQVIQ